MALIRKISISRNVAAAALAAAFFYPGHRTHALGPHECVLIANGNSPDSIEVANYYANLRNIPPANIITLDIPASWRAAGASITPEEFRTRIYDEVIRTLSERKMPHILAWVYSTDFPSTISCAPAVSLTGITFVRGTLPSPGDIESGKWPSPLFAGPDTADGPAAAPMSFENAAIKLGTNMPLPAMMLGWAGSRGMTTGEVLNNLRTSFLCDGSNPKGTFFFELSDDIRSKTRSWQFERAKKELEAAGMEAVISGELPGPSVTLLGAMLGRARYDPSMTGRIGSGAYADSLTSFGALFHHAEQTKITAWLMRGAAASAGSVTEPGSLEVPVILWPKFPSARLFSHYVAGCSLMESFYLATRSPLQILPTGDPLCRPWGRSPLITLINMSGDESGKITGEAKFMAAFSGGFPDDQPDTMFLMNGRPVLSPGKNSPMLGIQTTSLTDGYHELRAVSYSHGSMRNQGFATLGFTTANRNRGVRIAKLENGQEVDLHRPLDVSVSAEGEPVEVAIITREEFLARAAYSNDMTMRLDPQKIGSGPVELQAVAIYPGPEPVRSAPIKLKIKKLNMPPEIRTIRLITNEAPLMIARIESFDADADELNHRWFYNLLPPDEGHTLFVSSTNTATPGNESSTQLVYGIENPQFLSSIRSAFEFDGVESPDPRHQAGIIFNYTDRDNYMAWGVDGRSSAWVLRRWRDGREEVILSQGAPVLARKKYTLAIESTGENALRLLVDDEVIGTADLMFSPGKVGILAGNAPVKYQNLLASPPGCVNRAFSARNRDLLCDGCATLDWSRISAAASDGHTTVLHPVTVDDFH